MEADSDDNNDLSTIGGRLRWAYKEVPKEGREHGLRLFQRRIARRSEARARSGGGEIPGTTLPSIGTYVRKQGPRTPTVDFLAEAAALLGVRPEWLTYGSGPRSTEHAAADEISAAAQPGTDGWHRARALQLKRAVLRTIGVRAPKPGGRGIWLEGGVDVPPRRAELEPIPHWVAPLGEVWLRLYHRDMMLDPAAALAAARAGDESADKDAVRRVGKALRGPLNALGVDANQMREEALGDYLSAMVPALFALAAERSRQRRRFGSKRSSAPDTGHTAKHPKAKPTKGGKSHGKA